MPSRAESAATALRREGLLRGVAIAALLAAVIIAVLRLRGGDAPAAGSTHVQVSESPSAVTRDSLAALARAGHRITWSGTLAPLGVMAEPLREPGARWRLAAVSSGSMLVRDSLGPVDSLASAGALTLEPTRGPAQIVDGSTTALAAARTAAPPRRVLVLGRVGFEPRFIITALEEAGWQVDARLALGREREVRQGDPTLQLSTHDVVIVTDSATANREAAALLRFLRAGGGVILAGDANATSAAALRTVLAARVLRSEEPETRSFEGHEPTHALPLFALGSLARDAELLEDREGTAALVARRVEAGRLLQFGYAESWRWRMEGEGRSVEEHRAYWSRLAGMVARGQPQRPATRADANASASLAGLSAAAAGTDPRSAAPLAATVHALGPAVDAAPSRASDGPPFPIWLGPIILLALLAEWGSRRRRGAA